MRHLGVGGPAQTGGATDFGAVNKFHPGLVANSEIVDFGRQGAPHHVHNRGELIDRSAPRVFALPGVRLSDFPRPASA